MTRAGYRGYVSPRPALGSRTPQAVQNLVIRDYARRLGLEFKLSLVEYVMPGSSLVLEAGLAELPELEGLICYSLFQLPERRAARRAVYERVLSHGASLHCALEGLVLRRPEDIPRLEDLWGVAGVLARA